MAQDFDPTVDVRPTIAHGRAYDPRRGQHDARPFIEYPKWIHIGEGKDRKSIIANNKAEEDKILGIVEIKTKPPISIDISTLGQSEPVKVSKPRGRPKKAPVELPPNLD